eukprot:GEZU01020980.1.p1 GENE.GEZU01020980.1~~GEZU01020980.1.p1  ORF type:complete len:546 (-),score=47.71 GEZU01020980.1:218-1855(-)
MNRRFSTDDVSISYPYKEKEWLPWWILLPGSVVVPIVTMLLFQICSRDWLEAFCSVKGLLESGFTTMFFVEALQILVGRLRPDFLSLCLPDENRNCTREEAIVREGRRSFPSRHSGVAFSCLGYLTMFLLGKLKSLNYGKVTNFKLGAYWQLVISLLPILLAIFVSMVPYYDYRNHFGDIVVGAAIGQLFAFVCYRIHYPSVLADSSDDVNKTDKTEQYTKDHECDQRMIIDVEEQLVGHDGTTLVRTIYGVRTKGGQPLKFTTNLMPLSNTGPFKQESGAASLSLPYTVASMSSRDEPSVRSSTKKEITESTMVQVDIPEKTNNESSYYRDRDNDSNCDSDDYTASSHSNNNINHDVTRAPISRTTSTDSNGPSPAPMSSPRSLPTTPTSVSTLPLVREHIFTPNSWTLRPQHTPASVAFGKDIVIMDDKYFSNQFRRRPIFISTGPAAESSRSSIRNDIPQIDVNSPRNASLTATTPSSVSTTSSTHSRRGSFSVTTHNSSNRAQEESHTDTEGLVQYRVPPDQVPCSLPIVTLHNANNASGD